MSVVSATAAESALLHLAQYIGGMPKPEYGAAAKVIDALKGSRRKIGGQGTAKLVGLNEDELGAFEDAVAVFGRVAGISPSPGTAAERQQRIASLRVLSWVETIDARLEDLGWIPPILDAGSEESARRQVRAIELVLREVIIEAYGSDAAVEVRLREVFKDDVVDKWKRSGDKGAVLTGTMFSDLASFFSNKKEFPRYEPLVTLEGCLELLQDRRRTVQAFLEDVRRIRNAVAHNKSLGAIATGLLDAYFEELCSPIARAHAAGRTAVDPSRILGASPEELAAYVGALKEDLRVVEEDLAALSVRQDRSERNVRGLGVGIGFMVAAALLYVLAWVIWLKEWPLLNEAVTNGDHEAVLALMKDKMSRGSLASFSLFLVGILHIVAGFVGAASAQSLVGSLLHVAGLKPPMLGRLFPPRKWWHYACLAGATLLFYDSGMIPSAVYLLVILALA